ncbi:SOS-response transcriptional repressor LexA [Tahibacter aquaticus]|uniref:LexA repressor n=1 Tax=Tahibacter aquaticus TaxID=520092 RepID=A0A4R6YPH9_9GAMM|nr:transcriptional repressor LexA [Tahibacter aquaticus]TDR39687.1 SOS-response transcriptional repressor LexA [Tahibacter aquaticus]
MPLTDRQRAILAFIEERIRLDGFPPTQLEICAAFGFAQNATANYHLRALEEAGEITRVPGAARSIRLRNPARPSGDVLRLPVLGRVAAGSPIGADAEAGEEAVVGRALFSPAPDYLLRVKGDSMVDDGIFDGDLVAIRRSATARSGQTVVARLDDELTIKRLKIRARDIQLLPRNPAYKPITVPRHADFAIEGIFCGLIRTGA